MDLPSDYAVVQYRACVEDAFERLCDALYGACGGLHYHSYASVSPDPLAVTWAAPDPSGAPTTAHAILERETAEARSLELYTEMVGLFPNVPAYAEAPWAKPGITVEHSFAANDHRVVAIDLQPNRSPIMRSTPRAFFLRRSARILSALWTIPLVWPEPNAEAGTWELSFHRSDSHLKPRFWAPDAFSAQLVGALLWEPKQFQDWIDGGHLGTLVRRLPENTPPSDHVRDFLR
jgi:hypothetical protein